MTKNELLVALAEIMDIEQINEGMVLNDIDEWDSLAFVSIIVFYKKNLGIEISGEDLKDCKTVADLLILSKI